MTARIPLARFGGVPVTVGLSWLLVVPVVGVALFAGIDPERGTTAGRIAVAASGTVLMFASIVVHELGHALVALRRGVAVERVVVFLFGGYSEMSLERASPETQVIVTMAGPLASITLAAGLVLVAMVAPVGAGLRGVISLLAAVNVGVAVFNLLPAFPLDGGRILRALLLGAGIGAVRAERLAARVGIGCGLVLIAAGAALSLLGRPISLVIVPVGGVVAVLAAAARSRSAPPAAVEEI